MSTTEPTGLHRAGFNYNADKRDPLTCCRPATTISVTMKDIAALKSERSPMLGIEAARVGPIAHARLGLSPLTVLVGPNNAGKSYLATLLYGAMRTARSMAVPFPPYFALSRSLTLLPPAPKLSEDAIVRLATSLTYASREARRTPLQLSSLDSSIREYLSASVRALGAEYSERLAKELARCFSTQIPQLRHNPIAKSPSTLTITTSHSDLNISVRISARSVALGALSYQQDSIDIESPELSYYLRAISPRQRRTRNSEAFTEASEETLQTLVGIYFSTLFSDLSRQVHYLPAARGGIMQSHRALASITVSNASLSGLRPVNIPSLPGIVADFIVNLLQLDRPQIAQGRSGKNPVRDVAAFLEREAAGGEIALDGTVTDYPEITYQAGSNKYALYRTSSMISELAPIILYLKYIVRSGDVLIIEEPESHLHPAVQRTMAEALVRLVDAGVYVFVTTHSEFMLGQLNNHIRAFGVFDDAADVERRSSLSIDPGRVGAYFLHSKSGLEGSETTELSTSAEGIPQTSIDEVSSALYRETVELEERLAVAAE